MEIGKGRRLRSTLGGAGLAIAAHCRHRSIALEYAQFVASPWTQAGLYFESGGQPGHRAAWTDAAVNRASNGYFRETLSTLDEAWVRPRFPGYLEFQQKAGLAVHDYLWRQGDAPATIAQIKSISIDGGVSGTIASGDHYGFVAQQLLRITIGDSRVRLASGPSNDNISLPRTNDFRALEVSPFIIFP